MGNFDIGAAVVSDTNRITDYSVDTETTDAAHEQKETTWTNEEWPQYLGYYKTIPELASAIDAIAVWTVGKGFIADEIVTMQLDTIKGWGKETFNTILENAIRTMYVGGDAFFEIVRDDDENLFNVKSLDPGSMMIIVTPEGIIKRYEQISKVKNPNKKFRVDQILHFARNRIADEIHGVSIIRKLEPIILMRNEAMTDMKTVFHRYVKPFNVFKLNFDDPAEVAAFKRKQDSITENVNNIYIPMDTVEIERHSIPQFSTLNPLPWIEQLNQYFYQACGVPDIIVGSGRQFTEASAKIAYLAFQQTVEQVQLFIEEQILSQLGIEIELEFPVSLESGLLSDSKKDGDQSIEPNETTVQGGE